MSCGTKLSNILHAIPFCCFTHFLLTTAVMSSVNLVQIICLLVVGIKAELIEINVTCISVNIDGGSTDKENNATCPPDYQLTGCGLHSDTPQFLYGTRIDNNICYASGKTKTRAWARCCKFPVGASCTNYNAIGSNKLHSQCQHSNSTLASCTIYEANHNYTFIGAYANGDLQINNWDSNILITTNDTVKLHNLLLTNNTCTAHSYANATSSDLYASAQCCKMPENSNYILNCFAYWGYDGDQIDTVTCPNGYFMSGCHGMSDDAGEMDFFYINADGECRSKLEGGQHMYRQAICCQILYDNRTNVSSQSDPFCDNGVTAYRFNKTLCCPASCGECGGDGCSSRPGGGENCCTSNMKNADRDCSPCVVTATKSPTKYPTSIPTTEAYGITIEVVFDYEFDDTDTAVISDILEQETNKIINETAIPTECVGMIEYNSSIEPSMTSIDVTVKLCDRESETLLLTAISDSNLEKDLIQSIGNRIDIIITQDILTLKVDTITKHNTAFGTSSIFDNTTADDSNHRNNEDEYLYIIAWILGLICLAICICILSWYYYRNKKYVKKTNTLTNIQSISNDEAPNIVEGDKHNNSKLESGI